jgi:ribosomal protein S27E
MSRPRKHEAPENNHIQMRSWYCFDCRHAVCYVGRMRDRTPCALCGATYKKPVMDAVPEELRITRHQ